MIEGDERFALIEAGISQPGEMARLERISPPDVVLFTSLGDAHQGISRRWRRKCAEKLLLALRHAENQSITAPTSRWLRCCARSMPRGTNSTMRRRRRAADWPTRLGRNSQLVAAFWRVAGEPAPDFGQLQRVAMRLEVKEGDQRLAAGRRRLQFRTSIRRPSRWTICTAWRRDGPRR